MVKPLVICHPPTGVTSKLFCIYPCGPIRLLGLPLLCHSRTWGLKQSLLGALWCCVLWYSTRHPPWFLSYLGCSRGADSNHKTFLSPAILVYSTAYAFEKQNRNPPKQSFSESRKNKGYYLLENIMQYFRIFSHINASYQMNNNWRQQEGRKFGSIRIKKKTNTRSARLALGRKMIR